jgi:hypothetical protein
MTSIRTTSPDQVDGPTSVRGDSVRLSLKPSGSTGALWTAVVPSVDRSRQ